MKTRYNRMTELTIHINFFLSAVSLPKTP